MQEVDRLTKLFTQGKISRREFIVRATALGLSIPSVAALLSACAPGPPAATPTPLVKEITWPYDVYDFWVNQAKEFTKKTGIKVKYESVPFPQLHDKFLASFMAGGAEYDAVHVRDDWVGEFAPKGWLEPLDKWVTKEMKAENYPKAFDYLSYKGKIYGVPRYIWLWQFYYNKELLAAAGFKEPPTTWDDVRAMAKKLTKPPQYGWIATYGGFLSVNMFTVRLRAEGGEFMKDDAPTFNSPEGLKALEFMVDMIKDGSVDPSSFEMATTGPMTDIFIQGRVAMMISTPPTLTMAADPAKSKVIGKVDVALAPGSKLRSAGFSEQGGVGIPAASTKKEWGWEWAKFVCSREQQKKMAIGIGRIPTIPDLLKDPEVQAKYPAALMAAEQMKYPMGMAVTVPQQSEINTAVANEIVAALRLQKSPKEALADAEKATLKILGKK
ncbi:MAG: sugar ABC transporter substrate-binding protein [Chloroflexi bacterium]|nr:sugar ABC transporter substrate-binding protein [Chloroflexota bacterium]MCL5075675.1 sugar ABC transporter substrate-binding protein [Chloroflexota bacterium]